MKASVTAVADLQASTALEAAPRSDLPQEHSKLRNLTERAVSKGLFETMMGAVEPKAMLTRLRNEAAHGSTNFGAPAMTLTMIAFCAELIRQLYPDGEVTA